MEQKKVKTIDFPLQWIPDEWKKCFDIKLLEIDGRCEVLEDLMNTFKDSNEDFKKLIATIKMQLESDKKLKNERRLKTSSTDKDIIELKSSGGSSRLFCFFDETKKQLIICTNFYWKTTGKKKRQQAAFKRASDLKACYYQGVKR